MIIMADGSKSTLQYGQTVKGVVGATVEKQATWYMETWSFCGSASAVKGYVFKGQIWQQQVFVELKLWHVNANRAAWTHVGIDSTIEKY